MSDIIKLANHSRINQTGKRAITLYRRKLVCYKVITFLASLIHKYGHIMWLIFLIALTRLGKSIYESMRQKPLEMMTPSLSGWRGGEVYPAAAPGCSVDPPDCPSSRGFSSGSFSPISAILSIRCPWSRRLGRLR